MSDNIPTKEQLEKEMEAMELATRMMLDSLRAKRDLYRVMYLDNQPTDVTNTCTQSLNLSVKRRIV